MATRTFKIAQFSSWILATVTLATVIGVLHGAGFWTRMVCFGVDFAVFVFAWLMMLAGFEEARDLEEKLGDRKQ